MYGFLTSIVFLITLLIVLFYKRLCNHDYQFLKEVKTYSTTTYSKQCLPSHINRIYECTKCKKIKRHEI